MLGETVSNACCISRLDGVKQRGRAFKVGVDVVRELYGVMAARGATGGFVVTSGRFTEEANRFASGRNVTLVDRKSVV